MNIKEIEHMDNFGEGEYVFWLEVKDVPEKFIEKAKRIDKENFLEDCFGICITCSENEWNVCQGDIDCELYYIDNNGDKNWMEYILTEEERTDAIKICKEGITE